MEPKISICYVILIQVNRHRYIYSHERVIYIITIILQEVPVNGVNNPALKVTLAMLYP